MDVPAAGDGLVHAPQPVQSDGQSFRVATRYCKLADSYSAMVNLASWVIETRSTRRTAREPVYKKGRKIPEYNTHVPLALAMAA